MLTLGFLTFLTPAVLIAAAVLPLIWVLLRLTPPALRRIDFPAARLLFNLPPTERTSARTPPWLVALRIGLLALALFGLADPVLTAHRDDNTGPLIVVMDDGWASAADWNDRQSVLRDLLERAERHGRSAALITTAPPSIPGAIPSPAPKVLPSREILARAATLRPQPWPVDRAPAAAQLQTLPVREAEAVWITDGVATNNDDHLREALQRFGPITVIKSNAGNPPLILNPPQPHDSDDPTHIALGLRRVATDDAGPDAFAVRALDKDNHVLARATVTMAQGTHTGRALLEAPPELSNKIARFDVEGHPSAAATVLVDGRWQRRPVGIASTNANGISAPLLEDAFYIRQALSPFADVREGDLDELLSRPLAVLFMASGGRVLESERDRVTHWIEGGGILVRFAGPRLNDNIDSLLPVRLRSGGRNFGGTLSWSEPAHLAPFPETSPFKSLTVPEDVTVATQVLAEPSADLPGKTWARLNDGTPLITAERRGQGWVILFHVSATPDWSTVPLSGLFIDLLRQVVDLSAGVAAAPDDTHTEDMMPPLQLLDGTGHLTAPGPAAHALDAHTLATGAISPNVPPGLYGTAGNTTALNLAPALTNAAPITTWPTDATQSTLDSVAGEQPLKPYFLSAALILLLVDLVLSFVMRGLTPPLRRDRPFAGTATVIVFMAIILTCGTAHAVDTKRAIDSDTAAAILETRLAYIVTNDSTIDHMDAAGLNTLTQVLANRTSAEMAKPAAIDLNAVELSADTLSPYPLIYWRISPHQQPPNPKAAAALVTYLHRGGLVVFDAPDQAGAIGGNGAGARLETVLQAMDLPNLVALDADHVLTRTFYLLKGLPGRFTDGGIYVDMGSTATDGVASIIVGGNDWAAAWARDDSGLPLYPVVPGGERQREMAYRAGVNMVMYALTGNYKSDQVHLPAIMQRLTQ